MLRRLALIFTALVMTLALVSCGNDELVDKDTIEMYFSPAGTQDWYFALDFKRKQA